MSIIGGRDLPDRRRRNFAIAPNMGKDGRLNDRYTEVARPAISTNVICPSNDADEPGKGLFDNAITSTENSGAWVSFGVLHAEMGGSAIGSFVTRTLSPTLRGRLALASQHTSLGSRRNPQNEGAVVKTSSQLASRSLREPAIAIGIGLRSLLTSNQFAQ